jgi:crossover junction endodeoxyribonuclease RusA
VAEHLSACCGKPVTVWTGGEGTSSWECTGCGQACDARPAPRVIASLTLDIEPVAKARARVSPAEYERAGGVRVRTKKAHGYTPAAVAKYEEHVGWLLKQARVVRADEGDLAVAAVFHVRREADLDNLVKSLLDACNGVAWKDDRQVTRIVADLVRGSDHPRVELLITGAAGEGR